MFFFEQALGVAPESVEAKIGLAEVLGLGRRFGPTRRKMDPSSRWSTYLLGAAYEALPRLN
jgi:hypothetical protein